MIHWRVIEEVMIKHMLKDHSYIALAQRTTLNLLLPNDLMIFTWRGSVTRPSWTQVNHPDQEQFRRVVNQQTNQCKIVLNLKLGSKISSTQRAKTLQLRRPTFRRLFVRLQGNNKWNQTQEDKPITKVICPVWLLSTQYLICILNTPLGMVRQQRDKTKAWRRETSKSKVGTEGSHRSKLKYSCNPNRGFKLICQVLRNNFLPRRSCNHQSVKNLMRCSNNTKIHLRMPPLVRCRGRKDWISGHLLQARLLKIRSAAPRNNQRHPDASREINWSLAEHLAIHIFDEYMSIWVWHIDFINELRMFHNIYQINSKL